MAEFALDDPIPFVDALDAVRRAVIEPDELPRKVAAAAILDAFPAASPAQLVLEGWETEVAAGPGALDVIRLVREVMSGSATERGAQSVCERYGVGGVAAAVSLAALAVSDQLETPPAPPGGPILEGVEVKLVDDLVGLSLQLTRSFGLVPLRWRRLAAQRSAALRWWMLHESALKPGVLSGEEKWLAMAWLATTLGDRSLRGLYARFLVAQGWEDRDVVAALAGEPGRVRRGLRLLLPAAGELAANRLDIARFELAGADLPAPATNEMIALVRLARALVAMRCLGGSDGD